MPIIYIFGNYLYVYSTFKEHDIGTVMTFARILTTIL